MAEKTEIPPDAQTQRINYRQIWLGLLQLFKSSKRDFVSIYLCLAAVTACKLAGPVIIKYGIDRNIASGDYRALLWTMAAFLVCSLGAAFFNYRMMARLETVAQGALLELKSRMMRHLLDLDMAFFDSTPVGRIAARIQSDTSSLHQLFTSNTVTIVRDSVFAFTTLCVMFYFSPRLTLILLPLLPVIAGLAYYFSLKSGPLFMAARKVNTEISGFLSESMQGMRAIQSCSRQERAAQKLDRLNRRKFELSFKAEFLVILFYMSLELADPVSMSAILGFGGYWALSGGISVGTLIMFMLYTQQVIQPLTAISQQLGELQRSAAGAQHIFDLLATKNRIPDPKNPAVLENPGRSLEFRDVWFRYSPQADWALKNVSFNIPEGKIYALAGETGSGKSSVLNLIFKFYLPQQGAVLANGVDIATLSRAQLRKTMGLVQQDIYLFPGTLMDNLKMMDSSIPDSRVREALRSIDLDGFFDRHGLDKEINERGSNLSTGEKQIISLVRAFVLNPPFIALDEATSAVDPHTERLIQRATERLFQGRTCLVIAHRLATIRNADKILVVSKGEIKESGTHTELMGQDGLYAKCFRLQINAEEPEA